MVRVTINGARAFALVVAAVAAMSVFSWASEASQVNERLIAVQTSMRLNGAYNSIHLKRDLNLPRFGRVNSVVAIVSSQYGRGVVEVYLNDYPIGSQMVGSQLEVVQIPVNRDLDREVRSLQIRTRDDLNVVMFGVTLDDGYNPNPPPPAPYPGPTPPPYPAPNPAPVESNCKLIGAGIHNGLSWNYRISLNGSTLDAADNFGIILSKLTKLRQSGVCNTAMQGVCGLSGAGIYRGLSWNYRLGIGDEMIDAFDNFDAVVSRKRELEAASLCFTGATTSCNLLGPGVYRGLSWHHRVAIGDQLVDASDSLDSALEKMNKLRSEGFCR